MDLSFLQDSMPLVWGAVIVIVVIGGIVAVVIVRRARARSSQTAPDAASDFTPGYAYAMADLDKEEREETAAAGATEEPNAPAAAGPPPGYVPLEMPELWEPDAAPVPALAPAPQPRTPAPQPRTPAPQPRTPAPQAGPQQPPAPVHPHSDPPIPRTLADLRTGALAGRTFDTAQELAVAAVLEVGHRPGVVARLFRVPVWRIEEWVAAAHAKPAATKPTAHATPPPPGRGWSGLRAGR